MASTQKNVDLVIRARDETRRALQSAKSALNGFAAAQARTAARRGQFAALEKEFNEVGTALDAASRSAADLGRKLGTAKRPTQAMKTEFANARAEAKRLKDELLGIGAAAGRMNGRVGRQGSFSSFDQGITAREGAARAAVATNQLGDAIGRVAAYQQRVSRFAAFDELARGARTADTALDGLARDLPVIAAAQDRLAASTNRATGALNAQGRAGRGARGGGDLADQITGAAATRKGRGPLGLRPWEMQNLGYQVNDVITGLASGQRPMQVLAQQGGQIAQLFPQAVSAILRMAPAILAVTAVVAPFVAAMNRASTAAKTFAQMEQLLTRSGEGASYTASELAHLVDRLDDAGASAEDARAVFSAFVTDAVDPEYLLRFGDAAKDMAKILGMDLVEAANKLSDAFTGDADAVLSLDDELNFLTDTERKHVEMLRESKRDAEARTYAFAKFEERYGQTADKMKGPWSTILSNFGSSWDSLVDRINETDFGGIGAKIDWLMAKLARLTGSLPGAGMNTVDGVQESIGRNNAEIARLQAESAAAQNRNRPGAAFAGAPIASVGVASTISRNNAEIAQLRRRNAYLEVRVATVGALNGTGLLGEGPQPADTTLDPPRPANNSRGGRDRVSEAERLAKLQKEFNEDLIAQNAARAQDIVNLQLAARELEIVTAIEDARAKAADAQLEFSDDQAKAIRESVGALFDAKVEQETFNDVSALALQLAERRGEVEERAAYIARRMAEENRVATTAAGAALADYLGQMYDLEQLARDRANSEKSVTDLLTRQSELQQQITFAQEQGNVPAAEALRLQLEGVNAQLLLAINNSILFWRSHGGPDAAAAILNLQGLAAVVAGVGQTAIVTGKQIDDMITEGGVGAWNDFWDAVGQGQNAFDSLADAFRAFAADFLKQIAQMIIQQMILNALGGGKGGSKGGNTIAGFIQGLFRHDGGMVGSGGGMRSVPLAAFAGATRYHSGGIAGLQPNEIPAILKRGEEVLTDRDPRHRNNAGGKGGDVKVVNVFDPAELLDRALGTSSGERVFMNFVSRNSAAFKAAIQ